MSELLPKSSVARQMIDIARKDSTTARVLAQTPLGAPRKLTSSGSARAGEAIVMTGGSKLTLTSPRTADIGAVVALHNATASAISVDAPGGKIDGSSVYSLGSGSSVRLVVFGADEWWTF